MIGVRKNMIAVNMGFVNIIMYNPKIVKKSNAYETEGGAFLWKVCGNVPDTGR